MNELEEAKLRHNQKQLWKKLGSLKARKTILEGRRYRNFRSSLDIDNADKEFVSRIVRKIMNCEFSVSVNLNFSSFKGYHVNIYCTKKCDICRFVYDDFRRFAYDQNRPEYARNILFQEKEISIWDNLLNERLKK